MNNNTSIKQNKLLRFLIALILVISMSAQILAPHITVYAGGVDSNSISNGSDTEERSAGASQREQSIRTAASSFGKRISIFDPAG